MLLGLFQQQQPNDLVLLTTLLELSASIVEESKQRTPSKATEGCSVLAPSDSPPYVGQLQMKLLGHCKKDCEEPHHGIDALLPVEAQSNRSSFIPSTNFSIVSLVFSYGV